LQAVGLYSESFEDIVGRVLTYVSLPSLLACGGIGRKGIVQVLKEEPQAVIYA
jgi:hypothetical protein